MKWAAFVSFSTTTCWPLTKFEEYLVIFDLFRYSDIQSEKERMVKRRSWDLRPFFGIFGLFGNIVMGKGYRPLFRHFVCLNRKVGDTYEKGGM
jgi:hypothetical protein